MKETKVLCPKCNSETKQFPVPEQYKKKDVRGKNYCSKCGWVEGYTMPMQGVIGK